MSLFSEPRNSDFPARRRSTGLRHDFCTESQWSEDAGTGGLFCQGIEIMAVFFTFAVRFLLSSGAKQHSQESYNLTCDCLIYYPTSSGVFSDLLILAGRDTTHTRAVILSCVCVPSAPYRSHRAIHPLPVSHGAVSRPVAGSGLDASSQVSRSPAALGCACFQQSNSPCS